MPPSGVPWSQTAVGKKILANRAKEQAKAEEVSNMAPKKNAAAKAAAKAVAAKKSGALKRPRVEEEEEHETHEEPSWDSGEKRRLQSSMITGLKAKAKSGNQQWARDASATLSLYQSLGSRDSEKDVLLAKWLKNKNCDWISSYSSERSESSKQEHKELDAFGTKQDTQCVCVSFVY